VYISVDFFVYDIILKKIKKFILQWSKYETDLLGHQTLLCKAETFVRKFFKFETEKLMLESKLLKFSSQFDLENLTLAFV
jgi:hypothetical protein